MTCNKILKAYTIIFLIPILIFTIVCTSIGTSITYNVVFGFNNTNGIKNSQQDNCTKTFDELVCERSYCSFDNWDRIISGCLLYGMLYEVAILFSLIVILLIVSGMTELICCQPCKRCRKRRNRYKYISRDGDSELLLD